MDYLNHLKSFEAPYLLSSNGNSAKIFAEQKLSGKIKNVFVMDGSYMQEWEGFSKAFSSSFQFPNYYGDNGDALDEMMRDLSWLKLNEIVIIIGNAHKLLNNETNDKNAFENSVNLYGEFWKDPVNNGGWEGNIPTPFHVILHSSKKIVGFNAPLLKTYHSNKSF